MQGWVSAHSLSLRTCIQKDTEEMRGQACLGLLLLLTPCVVSGIVSRMGLAGKIHLPLHQSLGCDPSSFQTPTLATDVGGLMINPHSLCSCWWRCFSHLLYPASLTHVPTVGDRPFLCVPLALCTWLLAYFI